MSKVTIPKEVADRYRIEAGDEIQWIPAGHELRVARDHEELVDGIRRIAGSGGVEKVFAVNDEPK